MAGAADCCCPECDCTVFKTPLAPCQCMDADFGPYRSIQASITLSGSGTPKPIRDPIGGPDLCAAGTCPDPTGTYVLNCQTTGTAVWKRWCFTSFVCDTGLMFTPDHHYYIEIKARFTYDTGTDTWGVSFSLTSGWERTTSGATPDTTCADSSSSTSAPNTLASKIWNYAISGQTHRDYLYETFDCDPSVCENETIRARCPNSSTWDSITTTTPAPTKDACDPAGYTASLSFITT